MKDVSQFEEYKLVVRALEVIGVTEGWCVDFGAGDGFDCSNTHNLIVHHGFNSVQIEPAENEFQMLTKRYASYSRVHPIQGYVGLTIEDGLHTKLKQTPCPHDFDFMSIDIDGNDIYAWMAIRDYSSKLVLIEFNPSFPNEVDWRQVCDPNIQKGCSLLATVNVGKELGYELIAVTQINALFTDNSIKFLYDNTPYLTTLAQLYDGSLVVLGNRRLMWHRIEIDEDAIQILPKDLRSYYSSTIVRKVANKRVMQRGVNVSDFKSLPWYVKN